MHAPDQNVCLGGRLLCSNKRASCGRAQVLGAKSTVTGTTVLFERCDLEIYIIQIMYHLQSFFIALVPVVPVLASVATFLVLTTIEGTVTPQEVDLAI
jgi:hypothetical protein